MAERGWSHWQLMIGKASPNTAYTVRLRLTLLDIAPTVATSYMMGTLDGEPEQKGGLFNDI